MDCQAECKGWEQDGFIVEGKDRLGAKRDERELQSKVRGKAAPQLQRAVEARCAARTAASCLCCEPTPPAAGRC